MRALDRLVTIVVTATLTSAVWIVAGGTIMDRARVASGFASPAGLAAAPGATSPPRTPSGSGQALNRTPLGAEEARALVIPVLGKGPGDLNDNFTEDRGGGTRKHEALDIMAAEGAQVIAAAPGKVEKLFVSRLGGNTIYVRSRDGQTIYYYAHLQGYAPGHAEGQQVVAGQRLGLVGHTGDASPDAPHLHFAIMRTTPTGKWWEPSTPINPYPLLAGR
jgi:murein DD-endopeptidase MepM/ murein hydrolase activator NlpD